MVYKSYEDLTTLEVSANTDSISFDVLEEIIMACPSNMIYCETDGKLSGLISMGDISRADENGNCEVKINRTFTCVNRNEYMRAREIFKDKRTINALPIVKKTNVLEGGYVRWDEVISIKIFAKAYHFLERLQYSQFKGMPVILVKPSNDKNENLFHEMRDYVQACGIDFICVDRFELSAYLNSAWILFVDEDEKRGIQTVFYNIKHQDLNFGGFMTYGQFMRRPHVFDVYLNKIQKEGIILLNLTKGVRKYIPTGGAVGNIRYISSSKELKDAFFGELNKGDYAEQILSIPYRVENKSRTGSLKNYKSQYYNVENGERFTEMQPDAFERTIYFFGPCFIYGWLVEDKHTIESFLQNRFNASEYKVKVVNCGSPCYNSLDYLEEARILTTRFRKGDIIIMYALNRQIEGIECIDLQEFLVGNHIDEGWFTDSILHCNYKINALYADGIYDAIVSRLDCVDNNDDITNNGWSKTRNVVSNGDNENKQAITSECDFVKMLFLDIYFQDFEVEKYNTVGAIVMNCNPFTYGHRYLIEQAFQQVEFLIIFVVEEDRSEFSFYERFACVYEGVSDLDNVKVVPSGPFILSQMSFPEYFIKEDSQNAAENAENDILFFAEHIAPRLNITHRFVGEEPQDIVTSKYNIAMKRILPEHGIKLVEIPRKELDGEVISASRVRKSFEIGNISKIKKLVPESTLNVIGGYDVITETKM